MSLKFVFYIEDTETKKVLVEQSQMFIDITEKALKQADEADFDKIKQSNELIGDHFATRYNLGRGKYIQEVFTAFGVVISKFLDVKLAAYVGGTHRDSNGAALPLVSANILPPQAAQVH